MAARLKVARLISPGLAPGRTRNERDGKTVFLKMEDLVEVMQMQVNLKIKAADGTPIEKVLYHTINKLSPKKGTAVTDSVLRRAIRHWRENFSFSSLPAVVPIRERNFRQPEAVAFQLTKSGRASSLMGPKPGAAMSRSSTEL